MYDLGITSNFHILVREFQSWSTIVPKALDQAVRSAAQEYVRDCVKTIDDMIYSRPSDSDYVRTKKLRKGHKIKKLAEGVYLITNHTPYAIYQHDGWTDRGGNFHPGRPWMEVALWVNREKYVGMMDVKLGDVLKI
jgi:hypothetical protein